MNKINLQLVRDAFGRVVYTHKAHEKDAELQRGYAVRVKWINIILLALTSGSALTTLVTALSKNNTLVPIILTSVISFVTLGFSLFQLSFNPEQSAANHKQVAAVLWDIRERYRHLIADIQTSAISDELAAAKRDALSKELADLYKSAPATTKKGYAMASNGLKRDEEFTFSDEEIDKFLPSELALAKKE